jgi:hypothetical protein
MSISPFEPKYIKLCFNLTITECNLSKHLTKKQHIFKLKSQNLFIKMSQRLCLRHKSSGLVLDATNNRVTLQPYNGSSSQLWELQNTTIRSAQNG